jgi:Amt family ammonium transporter
LVGVVASVISYLACSVVKPLLGYDDALDTFGVHGVGGTLGALAAAFLVSPTVHPAGAALVEKGLVKGQLWAMAGCVVLSLVGTWLIAKLVDVLVGLRVSEDQEAQGLDIADHNEEGYNHG